MPFTLMNNEYIGYLHLNPMATTSLPHYVNNNHVNNIKYKPYLTPHFNANLIKSICCMGSLHSMIRCPYVKIFNFAI